MANTTRLMWITLTSWLWEQNLKMQILETIVKKSGGAIFNNAGQTLNHNICFTSFKPNGGGEPKGKLAETINSQFGSFDKFKGRVQPLLGTTVFGSGWVWLANLGGKLSIERERMRKGSVNQRINTDFGI